ncbi:hypothetical protein F5882DRAFT_387378 [Hyaloscypha sp. PMI_1271]|nr:hypothetical protein F5882DRAFT_387378 [Hyaloscypha sp. PMI_1271]
MCPSSFHRSPRHSPSRACLLDSIWFHTYFICHGLSRASDSARIRAAIRGIFSLEASLAITDTVSGSSPKAERSNPTKVYAKRLFFSIRLHLRANTPRATCAEAAQVFFEENNFVFDDRFNLEMFIAAIGERNGNFGQSVSIDFFRKSSRKHTKETRDVHKEWTQQFEYAHGQRLSDIPKADKKEQHINPCTEWTWVRELGNLKVKRFSVLMPSEGFTLGVGHDEGWKKNIECSLKIKECVNNRILGHKKGASTGIQRDI